MQKTKQLSWGKKDNSTHLGTNYNTLEKQELLF